MVNNIFGNSDKNHEEFLEKVDTHTKTILSIIQRQKDLESSTDLLNEKIELLDHNSIKNFKKDHNDIKSLRDDMRDMKQEIENLKELNSKISKQLKLMATKDDVDKLDKYIDLWNPMEFVTRQELSGFKEKIKEDLSKIIEKFLKT